MIKMKVTYLTILLIFNANQLFAQSSDCEKLNLKLKAPVTAFGFDSNNNIYIGTVGWGIYKSKDSGSSWTRFYEELALLNRISCLHFISEDVLLAGISVPGDNLDLSEPPLGIYRSTDGGEKWEIELKAVYVFSIFQDLNQNLYSLTDNYENRIYFSDDAGENWKRIENNLTDENFRRVAISRKGIIIINYENGDLYNSINRGESWNLVNSGTFYREMTFNSKGVLFSYSENSGLLKSFDNGKNWFNINLDLPEQTYIRLVIDKNDRLFIITQNQGLFISTDNGITWNNLRDGLLNKDITAIGFDKQNNIYLGIIQPDKKYEDDYYIVLKTSYK